MRLCRPGMVIGPQQHFLKLQEPRMWRLGKGDSATQPSSGSSSRSASAAPQSRDGSRPVTSSNSIHHPSPTPNYAHSQPNSPQTLNATSGHQSYSASFDAPPTMHQQRIVVSGQRGATSSFDFRGRSRVSVKPLAGMNSPYSSSTTSNGILHHDDAKDVHTPSSAPQALRNGSTMKITTKPPGPSTSSSSVARNLFDSKSWLTSPSQRRSPSAGGIRRGPTLSNPSSPQNHSHSASITSSSPLSSSSPFSPASASSSASRPKRSSSLAPAIGLRPTKPLANQTSPVRAK